MGVRGSTCMTYEYKNGKFSTNKFRMYISGENGITSKAKAKARDSYIACLTGTKPDQPRFTIIRSFRKLSKFLRS